jgi:TRAP-type C4-dicarboxylate transport system substrate-binding protein
MYYVPDFHNEIGIMSPNLVRVLLVVLIVSSAAGAGERPVTKLVFSGILPGHDALSRMFEEWCRELEQKTGGTVKTAYYPGGMLTPAQQLFDSVTTGIADIGFGPMGVTPGRFPLMEVIEQPLGIESAQLMTRLSNDFYRRFRPEEFSDVKVLFFLTASPGLLHTKKPVRRLEDLAGMKIRCLGGNAARVLRTLGAVPIVISTGDTYDALRKGIVDGVVAAWDALETMKWGEVLPYTTVCYYAAVGSPGFVIMNRSVWEALPPETQAIIDRMSLEYAGKLSRLWDEKDRRTIETWTKRNHVAIFLDEEEEKRWEGAVLPLYRTFVTEKSARGLRATEALNFCKEWVRRETGQDAATAVAGREDAMTLAK